MAPIGNRSPMMVKAQVSPAFRAKIRPHTAQDSKNDQPENRRPLPQCGQRLRSPRASAVAISFRSEDVIREPEYRHVLQTRTHHYSSFVARNFTPTLRRQKSSTSATNNAARLNPW